MPTGSSVSRSDRKEILISSATLPSRSDDRYGQRSLATAGAVRCTGREGQIPRHLQFATMERAPVRVGGFPGLVGTTAMLKLSCLAAIAVIGAANLSIASAQTPADVATERARPAPFLSGDDVPLRPNRAAVLRAGHQPPALDGKRPAVAEAKQQKNPEGEAASIPASAVIARARNEE